MYKYIDGKYRITEKYRDFTEKYRKNTEKNTENKSVVVYEIKPEILQPVKTEKKPRKQLSEESKLKRAETLKKAREAKKQINQIVNDVIPKSKEIKTVEHKAQEKISLLKQYDAPKLPEKEKKHKVPFSEKLKENEEVIKNIIDLKLNSLMNKKQSLRNFFKSVLYINAIQ